MPDRKNAPVLPATERVNPRTAGLDRGSAVDVVRALLDEERGVVAALDPAAGAIARAAEAFAAAIRAGGRVFYAGAGTSGRLGVLDASECPPTFGVDASSVQAIIAGGPEAVFRAREGAEDRAEDGAAAARERGVGRSDLVIGITASGRTPFVRGVLEAATAAGARTALVTCVAAPAIGAAAEIVIAADVGPEAIAGSTRLKAGTATKIVLNALSTAAMVLLGKVHGNLMVDLKPSNEKLVHRARRIVSEVAGVTLEKAEGLLAASGGDAKVAIVMHAAAVGADAARARLRESGDVLARAIDR